MLKVAVVNQKGGVGKTTTCVNLGAELARQGHRVLIVDADPQGNASSSLGFDRGRDQGPTVYEVLCTSANPQTALRSTPVEGLSLMPATLLLAGAELELATAIGRERLLTRKLQPLEDQFDLCLIDCPPSLGLLSVNAIVAADRLLVPVQSEYFALEGLALLAQTLRQLSDGLGRTVEMDDFLVTLVDERTLLAKDVVAELRDAFGSRVFDQMVPRNVSLAEAPSRGLPICLDAPKSSGAMAYHSLAKEVAERWALGQKA